MKVASTIGFCLILCLCLLAPHYASATTGAEVVVPEWTEDEFYTLRRDTDKCVIALFHADWSFAAKKVKKEFQQLASHFGGQSNYTEVNVGMVDGHKYRTLARREDVHVIPLVVFYMWGGDPHVLGVLDELGELIHQVEDMLDHDAKHKLIVQENQKEHERRHIPHPTPGQVVEFESEGQFEELVMDISRTAFVLFYATWCDACKEVKPQLEKVAKYFEPDQKVVIGRVECDQHKALCDKYKVDAFPTFYLFGKNREAKGGELYQGDRDADHLTQWLDSHNNIVVDWSEGGHHHEHEKNMAQEDEHDEFGAQHDSQQMEDPFNS